MCAMESLLGDYQSCAAETSTKHSVHFTMVVSFFITGDNAAVSVKKKKKAIEMFTFKKDFFKFFPRPIFLLNSADSTRQFLHNPTKRRGKLNEISILVNAVYFLHRLNLCTRVKHRWFAHLQVNHDKTAAK